MTKNVFQKAGLTNKDFETIITVLAVITATSSDAHTRLKCDKALKAMRNLKRIVTKKPKTRSK